MNGFLKKRQEKRFSCLWRSFNKLSATAWRRRCVTVIFPNPVMGVFVCPAAIDDIHLTERFAPFIFYQD
jgi:hypothetical protein